MTYRYNNGDAFHSTADFYFNFPSFAVSIQTTITNIYIFLSLFYSFIFMAFFLWMFLPPWKNQNICTVRNIIFLLLGKTLDMSQTKFSGTPGLSPLKLVKLWQIGSMNIYEQSDPYVHCHINLSNSSMYLKQLST